MSSDQLKAFQMGIKMASRNDRSKSQNYSSLVSAKRTYFGPNRSDQKKVAVKYSDTEIFEKVVELK
jgi:hypothetical protein